MKIFMNGIPRPGSNLPQLMLTDFLEGSHHRGATSVVRLVVKRISLS
jgi:hypothetical protein